LDIIRVYTKPIGKKPDMTDPVVLYHGSTVVDAAEEIHRDFAENLKFAKVWGGGSKYNGQSVSRDHLLEDGNIVEFHVPE
jgi:ribosome-interacting GTPase 1